MSLTEATLPIYWGKITLGYESLVLLLSLGCRVSPFPRNCSEASDSRKPPAHRTYIAFCSSIPWPQCIDQVQTKGATTTIPSTASVFPSHLWQAGRPDWAPQALLSITFHGTVIGAWARNGWKVGSSSPTGWNTYARYLPSCATGNFRSNRTRFRSSYYIARFDPSR